MINALIYSKDRACQLQLLLSSIAIHARKALDGITVLYTSSTPDFAQGYEILQKHALCEQLKIKWVQQLDLTSDTLRILREYCQSPKSLTTFFMDDNVFYKPIHDFKFIIESSILHSSDVACFSLRLGINTTEETYWQLGNNVRFKPTIINNLLKWKHTDYLPNQSFGYPMSLDGHVYRSDMIYHFVNQLGKLESVNGMEGALGRFKYEIPPCVVSFAHSVLVNVPINRVQNNCPNIAGVFFGITQEECNRRFLAGEIIDYSKIDFSKIQGTHQELAYSFKVGN